MNICCLSGSEVPISELADSIFAGQIADKDKVLVPSQCSGIMFFKLETETSASCWQHLFLVDFLLLFS